MTDDQIEKLAKAIVKSELRTEAPLKLPDVSELEHMVRSYFKTKDDISSIEQGDYTLYPEHPLNKKLALLAQDLRDYVRPNEMEASMTNPDTQLEFRRKKRR